MHLIAIARKVGDIEAGDAHIGRTTLGACASRRGIDA